VEDVAISFGGRAGKGGVAGASVERKVL